MAKTSVGTLQKVSHLNVSKTAKYIYDAASALLIGQRDDQEDAVSKDFVSAPGLGFAVLADGMGGHAAGDVASRVVVNEVFRQLRGLAANPITMEENLKASLLQMVKSANALLEAVAKSRPELRGMGSTLIVPIVAENRLYWASIGDSPLYLFRGSHLFRLNENHSVAGLLDIMVSEGEIDAKAASQHPERHCLTSVMNGSKIPHVDFRKTPFELKPDDIVIAASDGLQSIGEKEIARALFTRRDLPAQAITDSLLDAIHSHNDPDQDNVSLCVFKVEVETPSEEIGVVSIELPTASKRKEGAEKSLETKIFSDGFYRRASVGQ